MGYFPVYANRDTERVLSHNLLVICKLLLRAGASIDDVFSPDTSIPANDARGSRRIGNSRAAAAAKDRILLLDCFCARRVACIVVVVGASMKKKQLHAFKLHI